MRQVVLDTETTGLEAAQGHRIIEIGCVEVINRRITGRQLHCYIQPDREIDAAAAEVHGITAEFLADKPRFAAVVDELVNFVRGAELIIHNAPFDVGFLDAELATVERGCVRDTCDVLDSLGLARQLHPGQKNGLDALCKRYGVDNSGRELHGALLDARILAEVYLAMTGGQSSLLLGELEAGSTQTDAPQRLTPRHAPLCVIKAGRDEREAHAATLRAIDQASGGQCLWLQSGENPHDNE
ncbi:MAG: DNA polymerase III subunit epsilon [Gammaproteobacteria bacterium]|nr:DNA polymerase III subunit epsilon [Gammaproteobacteria bacterium]MBA3731311.1 DNA polymerase III subunit epsilon [Gammaproteobacteria bacterium]